MPLILCYPHPERCSQPGWLEPWAVGPWSSTRSGGWWPCLWQGHWSLKVLWVPSNPRHFIPWFCDDSIKFSYCWPTETTLLWSNEYSVKLVGGISYLAWIARSLVLQASTDNVFWIVGFFCLFVCCFFFLSSEGWTTCFWSAFKCIFFLCVLPQGRHPEVNSAAQVNLIFTPKTMVHWCLLCELEKNTY